MTFIELRGVRVHNLKSADVAIPVGQFTVVTGVSGAGKSSLVFDTLFAESQRRYLQSFSTTTRQLLQRFDQPDVDWISDLPPAVAVRASDCFGTPETTLAEAADLADLIAAHFTRYGVSTCPVCLQVVTPRTSAEIVSLVESKPAGTRMMIGFPDQPGDGESREQWIQRLRDDGWFRLEIAGSIVRLGEDAVPETGDVVVIVDRIEAGKTTSERLFEAVETAFRRGDGRIVVSGDRYDRRWRCVRCDVPVSEPEPRLFRPRDPIAACQACRGVGCGECGSSGFNTSARSVHVQNRSIADIYRGNAANVSIDPGNVELAKRLNGLVEFGLGHLPLGRAARTLSSGESQRLRLFRASCVELTGALFLYDEPTAGLQADEIPKIASRLTELARAGNTVVAIDHQPELWRRADYLIDLGPEAGRDGGNVVYQGQVAGVADFAGSFTGEWFADSLVDTEPSRRHPTGEIRVDSIAIPLGVMCVIAGPTGSGKTRFLRERLLPALEKGSGLGDTILFDASPLPRSSRSNPATVMKVFDEIRQLFADTTDAKIRNFDPGFFSFNQPGGRCETCEGQGTLVVKMQFLADVAATCPECLGRRYRRETLEIKVRNLNIAETLDLTGREAFRFFRTQRSIEKKLKWMLDVGLDYLTLGQPLDTLSSGEMQRLKLAAHLAKSRKPRSAFVLIEPTRGLHPRDVIGLVDCFGQLVDAGHSLIIEDPSPIVRQLADVVRDLDALESATPQ